MESPPSFTELADSVSSNLVVDVHTHVYLPKYMDMMKGRQELPFVRTYNGEERLVILPEEDVEGGAGGRPIHKYYWDVNEKLEWMDKHSIDAAVISLANPWLDFMGSEEAKPVARELNAEMHDVCSGSNGRFYGFGCLPSLSVDGCLTELDRIAESEFLRGCIIGTNGLGKGLDDPALDAIWRKAADLNIPFFLHPHYGIGGNNLFDGDKYGHSLFLSHGFPFETCTAVSKMVLSGVFEKFPNLQFLLAHSGGVLPFLAGRIDGCALDDPKLAGRLPHRPTHYLKKLYYDAVNYHAPAMTCTADFAGVDRMMFGTDHPFSIADPQTNYAAMGEARSVPRRGGRAGQLSEEEIRQICGENAVRFLDLRRVQKSSRK